MRQVGAVLFEGFEMLDLYGPLEMFSMLPDAFTITTIAQSAGPVRASNGPATVAEASFADRSDFDILLVPGGAGTRSEISNPALLNRLAHAGPKAEIIISSVCTGSALLAAAGLLEGHSATTNKLAFDWVASTAPQVDWRRRARWVESGNRFTSSGVSAGIDMTLALIARLLGNQAAADAALWAEYTPNTDPDNDPFAKG